MTAASRMPQIVFTGGGPGRHLFPGLAVAEQMRNAMPQIPITFAGSGKPLEREQVAAAGLEYLPLPCRPWPRRFRDLGRFVVDNVIGYHTARRFLAEHPVAAVVGLGGYTSGPMARAAISCGIPLVLLEQNVIPGRVNRWLAPRAALVCTSFPITQKHLPAHCRVRCTGTPIRNGFQPASTGARQLLILGGSSGARTLNEHVPQALARIGASLAGWQIVHQTGPVDAAATQALYRSLGLTATVVPFLNNMPRVLAATGLAICRAGGATLAELAAAGIPAILVPYPYAANNHQRLNADLFAMARGSVVLDDRDAPGQLENRLVYLLPKLLDDSSCREAMSQAMQRLAKPHAARDIAKLILPLAGVHASEQFVAPSIREQVATAV